MSTKGAGKLRTRTLKINAAEHCNLRCADCSHLSPYARPRLASPESVAEDLARLSEVMHTGVLGLQGGEPLLNPEVGELARIARASGIADRVALITNGLLLDKADDHLWEHLDDVYVSVYPDAAPSEAVLAAAEERAAATNTKLTFFPRPIFSAIFVPRPHPSRVLTQLIYHACLITHRDQCQVVSDGRLYRCAVPLGLGEYLRRLNGEAYHPAADGLAIHECGDLRTELRRYLSSMSALDCCRYCLGSAGVRHAHRQMTAQEVAQPGACGATPLRQINAAHLVRDVTANLRRRIRKPPGC